MGQPQPLGFPGGPCHVVQRIHEEVRDPRLRDTLTEKVEQGQGLSNPEAAKVYDLEVESGTKKIFQRLRIGPHAQYRMDLRGITVPLLRKSLLNFLMQVHNQNAKSPGTFDFYMQHLNSREGLRWEDPKLKLVVVLRMDGPNTVKIITTFWKGDPDPKPPGVGNCEILAGYSPPVSDMSGYRTFVKYPDGNHAPDKEKVPAFPSPSWSQMDLPNTSWTYNGPGSSGEGNDVPVRTVPKPGEESPPDDEPARNTPKRRPIEGGLTVRQRPRKRQRRRKGEARIKSRMYYKKNKNKAKIRARRRYKRLKKNPKFRRQQQIRQKHPQRFRRKMGYVLTTPEIAFVVGTDMQLGYVHNVSPMTGLVTYYRGNPETNESGFESMDIPDFLAAVGFLSDEDADAMFRLIDVEVGLEGYEDITEDGLRDSMDIEGIDCETDEFRTMCERLVQKRELQDMTPEDLAEVESYYVQNLIYDEGRPQFPHKDETGNSADLYMIDSTDDDYIYGTVDLPEDYAVSRRVARRYVSDFYRRTEPPKGNDVAYDRASPFLRAEMEDNERKLEKTFPPKIVPNNPGSAKVIPDEGPVHDFVNNKAAGRAVHWRDMSLQERGAIFRLVKDPLWRRYVQDPVHKERDVLRWLQEQDVALTKDQWWSLLPELYSLQGPRVATLISEVLAGTGGNIQDKAGTLPVKMRRVDPQQGLWLFDVKGSREPYRVKVKLITKGNVTDPNKADVLVSCSCPFWQWQGPEYYAKEKGYLYGKPRGTASKPDEKDPNKEHGACKHVIAVLNRVSKFLLPKRGKLSYLAVSPDDFGIVERVTQGYLLQGGA